MTTAVSKREPLSAKEWALALVLAITVILSSFTFVDDYAESDLDSLFQRALITFALARTLNGVISAVQGTEIALQPAGVGLTLTPGEILDPVNDLVERFSWIMLGATISLGVQQVLLEVGQWWVLRVLVVLLSVAWLGFRLWRKRLESENSIGFESMLLCSLLAVIFIRFAVPLALVANEGAYNLFLESRYLESTQELESAGDELERASNTESESSNSGNDSEGSSLFGRFFANAKDSLDFEEKLKAIRERTGGLIGHLVQLSVVFILQTGIFPIVFLWLMLSLLKFTLSLSLSKHRFN